MVSEPVPARPTPCHNLPTLRTRVVGRSECIHSILESLRSSRLVSIVGTGGVGKTTVAIEAAAAALSEFDDGVWMVDLSPLKEPALVPSAISTSIGLTAQSANMLAALCGALRDRNLLLVLDNCEHLIEAVATVARRLIDGTNKVRILATSRERLAVRGERVKRLTGLSVPPADAVLTPETALSFPAVRLFVDRARDRNTDFALTQTNTTDVAAICRKLDGVALAIELAATRADTFAPAELLRQLDDRFHVLRGLRGAPERHRTLTAMVDWSYGLLPESQRSVMRRLSIFAGTFGVDAACAIAANGAGTDSVVADLRDLVEKSLVVAETSGAEADYRLLDTNRHFAFARLAATPDFDTARQRHAAYCLQLVRQAKHDAAVLPPARWLDRYRPRTNDVREALNHAGSSDGDPDLLVRLTVAAIPYWEQLSLLEECRTTVERALAPCFAGIRSRRDDLILHLSLGATLLFTRGPVPEAKRALSCALEIAVGLGDTSLQLECLRGLSQYVQWAGDSRASLAIAGRMRRLSTPEEDGIADHKAYGQAGAALQQLGDLRAARQHLEMFLASPPQPETASDFSRFEFDQRLEAQGALALAVWLLGYPDTALNIARAQVDAARQSHFAVPYCAAVLLTWTCITLYTGDFEETERSLDTIEAFATEHGLNLWKAMAACMRVKTHLDMRKPVDRAYYWEVLEQFRGVGFGLRYPPFLGNYGDLLSREGDHVGALIAIDQAMTLYTESGQHWGIPEMLTMKGNFIRAAGQTGWCEAAADCYLRSIEIAQGQGTLTWELRAAIQLVEMWRIEGGNENAERALTSAFGRFQEGFETVDLKRARALISAYSKQN